jgi:hypothetical protein
VITGTSADTFVTGETITLAYTQPGDGIEDIAGNDLASFSGESVTNNVPAACTEAIAPLVSPDDYYAVTAQIAQRINLTGTVCEVWIGIHTTTSQSWTVQFYADDGTTPIGSASNAILTSTGTVDTMLGPFTFDTPPNLSGNAYITVDGDSYVSPAAVLSQSTGGYPDSGTNTDYPLYRGGSLLDSGTSDLIFQIKTQ